MPDDRFGSAPLPGCDVRSPVRTEELLDWLPAGPVLVQFSSRLTDADYEVLGDWTTRHGDVTLRMYGSFSAPDPSGFEDLEFLRFYPALSGFVANCLQAPLHDADGLRHLPSSLRELGLGFRLPSGFDVATLGRFTRLQRLTLSGNRRVPAVVGSLASLRSLQIQGPVTGLPALDELDQLRDLDLWSVTFPGLSPLAVLPRLERLRLTHGGTKNLADLPSLAALREFEAWQVRGLSDVSAIGRCATLEVLQLAGLPQVTHLPDLSAARSLRHVRLQLAGVTDLSPLADAPALETALVIARGPDDLADLEPLRSMRAVTLQLTLDTGARTVAARQLLALSGRTARRDGHRPGHGPAPSP